METTETTQDPDHGKKCYIFWLHSHYPINHPRKGDKTMFEQLVVRGVKIHGFIPDFEEFNYSLLRQITDELDEGTAYVSLQIRSNKRISSNLREVKRLYKIGVQEAKAEVIQDTIIISIDGNVQPAPWVIASSDGMCLNDMKAMLCPDGRLWSGCIVHFTDMRY